MDSIKQFIQNDFPYIYQNESQDFISFIQAYFEWLEETGNVEYLANNLFNFKDIDNTTDQFLSHFQSTYLNAIPANIAADRRLLVKHVKDLYASKGTKRGFALLFRILFNEDIEINLPGRSIFKTSDNTWVIENFIEVSDSVHLASLVGMSIFSLNGGASALVESFDVIKTNNKSINVLTLSNINGIFNFNDFIMSNDVNYDVTEAPFVVGSLSSFSIDNGGEFFNVGDLVTIVGTHGSGATGRINTVVSENGKVIFTLNDGGYGFTVNAIVSVVGGAGTGASFKVGSLVNQTVYPVSTDIINTYYSIPLENGTVGFNLGITGKTGTFTVGNTVTSSANTLNLDVTTLFGGSLTPITDVLSNSSLGISGLNVIKQDQWFVSLWGTEASLNNANIVSGTTLTTANGGISLQINCVIGKENNISTGTVVSTNSSSLILHPSNGYFSPGIVVKDLGAGGVATVSSTLRDTNWAFPVFGNTNLDSIISNALTTNNIVIGTIASLKSINPGSGYASDPVVYIDEPSIHNLMIDDGNGGVWGYDANVTSQATFSSGIATSLTIVNSGYGFQPNENLSAYSANNPASISGSAIVDGNGQLEGYWLNNRSFLSDLIYLQDSYYRQNFSFEIVVGRLFSNYENIVNTLCAPAGYLMFGKYSIKDNKTTSSSIKYTSMNIG